jgi:hypothetical protein
LNSLRRIDRRIRELKALRQANFEQVRKQIALDKKRHQRGNVDPAKVLALLEKRVAEYGADHSSNHNLAFGFRQFCDVTGLPYRQILRAKASGWMTFNMADKICCRLGVPTATVYPYEQGALWEVAS